MTAVTHDVPTPGTFIREELEARNWLQRDLAYVLGIPEQAVNMIVSGKRGISAEMAKALGDAFGVSAELFANLQKIYDLSKARDPDPNIAKKARLQQTYPVREMIKRGWIVDADTTLIEVQMATFFGVQSPDEIPLMAHAAKKTDYDEVPPAQLAWLFRVRQIAREMVTPKYSETRLKDAIPMLSRMLSAPEEIRHVPRILAECGVRYVVVEALPGAKIDGVTTWDGKSTPIIGMSIKRDRIDNFWFVLRHECEHVLQKHGQDFPMIDADLDAPDSAESISDQERVANLAASDFCVPKKEMNSYYARKAPYFSEREMIGFANRLQIHPGLVAGQLRRRLDRWDLFTKHLVKVRQIITASAVSDGWGQAAPVSS